jgi:hypothetical protein
VLLPTPPRPTSNWNDTFPFINHPSYTTTT